MTQDQELTQLSGPVPNFMTCDPANPEFDAYKLFVEFLTWYIHACKPQNRPYFSCAHVDRYVVLQGENNPVELSNECLYLWEMLGYITTFSMTDYLISYKLRASAEIRALLEEGI